MVYNVLQVNRFVEVNFNCLETTVNLETWVLVLEFIGIGGKFVNPELFTRLAQQARIEEMASGISTTGVYRCVFDSLIYGSSLHLQHRLFFNFPGSQFHPIFVPKRHVNGIFCQLPLPCLRCCK